MRVLMLSKACLVGAYQRKLEEIARLGVELLVVVPPSWRDERGTIPLERAYTRGYDLVVEPIALNGHFHLHFYPRLGRRFRCFHPHIVHIDEEPYNLATFQAMRLARRYGARALFFSWQNLLRRYPIPFRWMERYVLRHAAYGLVGNREAAQVWRAKGYQGPLRVIPQFGVDPDLFHPPASGARPPGSEVTIGYVGRLVAAKGVDLLLEAVAGLSGPWRLRLWGDGPERPRLEMMARRLGIAHRVAFQGQVSSLEMPACYHQMDLLVLPSRTLPNWKEQFGRVLVEAMASGLPVVGSDSGEIPHVIGEAGLIFPEGDVAALRVHLARLLGDASLRERLGRRGRERVLAHYTQARIAAQTVAVYREMLSAHAG